MNNEAINNKTLRAFLFALAQQKQPIPAALQTQLNEIGQQIQQDPALLDQPVIDLIQPLLQAHPTLLSDYQVARAEINKVGGERVMGGPIDFYQEASTAEITNVFKAVLQSNDSIRSAQQKNKPNLLQRLLGK
jgi:hypothetical protein